MNTNTTQTALTGRNLVKSFGAAKAPTGVDVAIPAGQPVVVIGPSGSGKSAFLHCLSGILPVTLDEITVDGTSVTSLSGAGRSRPRLKAFGFILQDDQLIPELPVNENVALPLMLMGASRRSAIRKADSWLTKVGLGSERKRRSGEMSGGQAQRVVVAWALASSLSVVFADEPTNALDQATGHEIMRVLMTTVRMGGATFVMVTHGPNVAAWYGRLIEIRDGRIHVNTTARGAHPRARRPDPPSALSQQG